MSTVHSIQYGRVANYRGLFSDKHPENLMLSGEDSQIIGMWRFGNTYRSDSDQYGSYPTGYLARIKALFPEKHAVLHLFSGKVNLQAMPGDTCDINPDFKPTWVDDAQTLDAVPIGNYDLILADPPYSVEDAEHYQRSMIKRNKVMRALARKAERGTHVVWLDQVLPMYRKDEWLVRGLIGVVRSTNHRFRVVTIFERSAQDGQA